MPVRHRHVLLPLLAAAATAVASPVAHAQAPSPPPSAGSTGGAVAAPEPELATASAGAVSVSTRAGAMLRRTARFTGAIPASDAGRVVTIERLDELTSQWLPVAHATAADDGAYVAKWKTDRVGPLQVRARVEAPDTAAAAVAPQLQVTVFRTAVATWYGPGFWGHKTACGTRLRRGTYGVAHKKLKCGTLVTLFYKGRTVTVPVIDRGPFRKGTSWDLTQATAQAIGFETTDTVGTLRAQPAG